MYKRGGWGNAPERKVKTQEWGAKAAREHPTHGTAIGTETNRPEKAIEPALGNPQTLERWAASLATARSQWQA